MSDEIDWKNPFKPEDFYLMSNTGHKYLDDNAELFAVLANARFRELLEKAPKVYGNGLFPEAWEDRDKEQMEEYFDWNEHRDECDTHSARLIDVRELK